jgi:cytochrome c peroxidase
MNKKLLFTASIILTATAFHCDADESDYVFKTGHSTLQTWLLPDQAPTPVDNKLTKERVELGKKLFFDPRLSGDGNMSCATCHNPVLGWSDGLPTAKGFKSMVLGRASPTVINTGYNDIQMWDGRKATLEEQAMGPMEASVEMNMNTTKLFEWINTNEGYKKLFKQAFPDSNEINSDVLSKALASYERTIISNNSPFDRWVNGEANAMTEQQVNGFKLFVGKANCEVCHSAPNFTDNGFHNLGLASWGNNEPDMGRYTQKPIRLMKGAFKTPTLRNIAQTAPYFHDGSAKTLMNAVEHYNQGGVVKTNLSPNINELNLSAQEKNDLVAFMQALTSPMPEVALPELPLQ